MAGKRRDRARYFGEHLTCAADGQECGRHARMLHFGGLPIVPLCPSHELEVMRSIALDLVTNGNVEEGERGWASYCRSVGREVEPLTVDLRAEIQRVGDELAGELEAELDLREGMSVRFGE